jgi:hypothetical protein
MGAGRQAGGLVSGTGLAWGLAGSHLPRDVFQRDGALSAGKWKPLLILYSWEALEREATGNPLLCEITVLAWGRQEGSLLSTPVSFLPLVGPGLLSSISAKILVNFSA